eukprot:13556335-Heterocapsa_arctica.AAC.1
MDRNEGKCMDMYRNVLCVVVLLFLFVACLVPMDSVGNGYARPKSVQQPWPLDVRQMCRGSKRKEKTVVQKCSKSAPKLIQQ